jgi:2-aminoadipate transaminase
MSTHPRQFAGVTRLATRMKGLKPSAVREILKVAESPEVISFAGGLPAPELFPVEAFAEAFAQTFAKEGAAALQYGVTEGFGPLREWIAARLARQGIKATASEILITSGAQQGLDLVGKVLLDPADRVVVEEPTYLAAAQVFHGYQAELVGVPGDDQGMRVDELPAVLGPAAPALLYVVPEFQNPSGTSLDPQRRQRLVDWAATHQVPVLEDDPYGELRFEGVSRTPLAALTDEGVIRLGTFSKILAPGVRLGWVHARAELIKRLTVAKQFSDLHTSTLNQRAVSRLLETFDLEGHLAKLRRVYRERRDQMLQGLEAGMPAGTRWTRPEGGLFLWLELPPGVDDEAVFRAAVSRGVAPVPGSPFFHRVEHRFLRLNFSNQSRERIADGIQRLGEVVTEAASTASGR